MPDYGFDNEMSAEDQEAARKYNYAPQAVESPVDWVPERIASHGIQNPDDVIGLCSECKSTHERAVMEKDIFAAEGVPPSCRYCGGVVVITYREIASQVKERLDGARGIDRS